MTSQTPEKIMRTMSAPTTTECACTDRSCIIAALMMRTPCVNEASDASQAIWVNCLAADSAHRGVFVASRSAAGSPVCSGGDHYRCMASSGGRSRPRGRFLLVIIRSVLRLVSATVHFDSDTLLPALPRSYGLNSAASGRVCTSNNCCCDFEHLPGGDSATRIGIATDARAVHSN